MEYQTVCHTAPHLARSMPQSCLTEAVVHGGVSTPVIILG